MFCRVEFGEEDDRQRFAVDEGNVLSISIIDRQASTASTMRGCVAGIRLYGKPRRDQALAAQPVVGVLLQIGEALSTIATTSGLSRRVGRHRPVSGAKVGEGQAWATGDACSRSRRRADRALDAMTRTPPAPATLIPLASQRIRVPFRRYGSHEPQPKSHALPTAS